MTIRRTLLLAFLAVGLLPALALTLLAFTRTQAAMRVEIGHALATQAQVTAADLDKLMFERLQNAVTWEHLEVMQDLRVGDIDKRLSNFLAEMKRRYDGAYLDLHVTDRKGRIVASSEPAALGQSYAVALAWRRAVLSGGRVDIEAPRDDGAGHSVLVLRTAIRSQFDELLLGELVLRVNWAAAAAMLDSAARERRAIAVVDDDGRVISASAAIRARPGAAGLQLPPAWRDAAQDLGGRAGAPLLDGDVIAGRATSPGAGAFGGFGWTTLVLQPTATALAPVRQMALSFASILLATAAVTVLLAMGIAARIARPIVALTVHVRGFMHNQQLPPPVAARGEVGELTRAFTQMIEDLDASRQTLVRASQLAAIGEFSAMMAHEIRTPLGILRSSAQMLQQEPQLSGEGRELAGFVVSETDRLNKLVAAMLDRARVRAPQPAAENLEALIDRCLAMLRMQAQRQGVRFERQFNADNPIAEVDAEQLMQVMFNLLQNALQALSGGGLIRVTLRRDAESLIIEVADNGPGIPPAERQRMFEPFVYRREGGLGLGLAIVKQIVAAHGGDIGVDAGVNGGTVFRIRLPLRSRADPV